MASESALAGGDSYIGSFISLISKYEIRYEGILYCLNVQDSTIGLKNVRSYGTEGRKRDGPQIPPSDKVYEYILFRGSDIKDLQVKSTSPTQTEEQIHNDPAIIQSHYAGTPVSFSPSALAGLTESSSWQDTPALLSKGYPTLLSSNQSIDQGCASELSPAAHTANSPSLSMAMLHNVTSTGVSHSPQSQFTVQPPSTISHLLKAQQELQAPSIQAPITVSFTDASEYLTPVSSGYPSLLSANQSISQGGALEHSPATHTAKSPSLSMEMLYNGTSIGIAHSPQNHTFQPPSTMSHLLKAQQELQSSGIQSPMTVSMKDAYECLTPVSSTSTSTYVHPKFSPSLPSVQFSTSLDMPSSLPTQGFLPSHRNEQIMNSFPLSHHDLNVNEAEFSGKAVSDPIPVLPVKSVPYPLSSFMGLNISPSQSSSSSLLTPDQVTRLYGLPSSQKMCPENRNIGALTSPSSTSPFIPTPVTQAPLLPLPDSNQKFQYATTQFTEEFDFMAMNEKFKKDEVWGHLGKVKEKDKAQVAEDNAIGHNLEDREGRDLIANQKPAYNKDEFFDTISCNSLNHGQRAQNRFSERMKLDTKTFGFQQRPNLGYGGYGGGRGDTFHGSYNWGRGYGYGRRGRGGNVSF
ncbi:hypothetical protein FNV43_RR09927 [Rhamnella rubrinervis]|uniref:Uncharacterized protein n=1 Tax=Rhamnella rubrinervis TaxID=2594499 RepID=A0A8K0HBM3_9ROSA|nr:hypothetical protein FNV43_RR09927 [Rhamnella rubrinervis]